MNRVFADTWFYLAILNPNDPNHQRAVALSRTERRQRVTQHGNRDVFARFFERIHQQPSTIVVPASRQLLEEGVHLYRYRRDKDWPLTDCISFMVMDDEMIRDALTGDQHFEQAGFTALLR